MRDGVRCGNAIPDGAPSFGTLPIRRVVKCPTDGWYVEDRVQLLLNLDQASQTMPCRYCHAQVPFEGARQSAEPPECPAGCGPLGTPILDSNGDLTTDHWDGPPEANIWCPACGRGWLGDAAAYDGADRAWQAHQAQSK
jgi:hypothetical protein